MLQAATIMTKMITPEIIKYVSAQLAAGFSAEVIKQNLSDAGWEKSDIDMAISSATNPTEDYTLTRTATSTMDGLFQNSAPVAEHDISHDVYPVTMLRGFKLFIIFIGLNLLLVFSGKYSLEVLIATPFFLIHDPIVRARFKYRIDTDGVYLYEGKSHTEAKAMRFTPFATITSVRVHQDWFDMLFGIAKVQYSYRKPDAPAGKPKSFRLLKTSSDESFCMRQIGTLLPVEKCTTYRIPGLHKEHAEILTNLIQSRIPIRQFGVNDKQLIK